MSSESNRDAREQGVVADPIYDAEAAMNHSNRITKWLCWYLEPGLFLWFMDLYAKCKTHALEHDPPMRAYFGKRDFSDWLGDLKELRNRLRGVSTWNTRETSNNANEAISLADNECDPNDRVEIEKALKIITFHRAYTIGALRARRSKRRVGVSIPTRTQFIFSVIRRCSRKFINREAAFREKTCRDRMEHLINESIQQEIDNLLPKEEFLDIQIYTEAGMLEEDASDSELDDVVGMTEALVKPADIGEDDIEAVLNDPAGHAAQKAEEKIEAIVDEAKQAVATGDVPEELLNGQDGEDGEDCEGVEGADEGADDGVYDEDNDQTTGLGESFGTPLENTHDDAPDDSNQSLGFDAPPPPPSQRHVRLKYTDDAQRVASRREIPDLARELNNYDLGFE